MPRFALCVTMALVLMSAAAVAAVEGSAARLFLRLAHQAAVESDAAARTGRAGDAKTWSAWERLYRQDVVSPNIEGKSALDMTDELERSNIAALKTVSDPRAVALYRASARLWHDLHEQLAAGKRLVVAFPKREMLTRIPGLAGTPWQAGINATAADCAALAQRVQFCEAQAAQMQHEIITGLYEDRSTPLLMQEHQCHKWEEMQVAYCAGR